MTLAATGPVWERVLWRETTICNLHNKEKHKDNKNKEIMSINNKIVLSKPMKVINNNIH
jgi:hypothetical protein